MIIFDLDGTLADCSHRRHFVDPEKNPNFERWNGYDFRGFKDGQFQLDVKWKPDYKSFYEACDKDVPIEPTIKIIKSLFSHDYYGGDENVHIWSGRCESVRYKTEKWLSDNYIHYKSLKMRPIGDNTPDDQLKEQWLDEIKLGDIVTLKSKENVDIREGVYPIEFVFDCDLKSIEMWRRRGIFVFNRCQHDGEF